MSSYVVIDTEILDQQAFSEFSEKIYDALTAHGGTYLVRGGEIDVIEGEWTPQRIVVMAFDSDAGAGEFVRSADYAALQGLRQQALRSNVLVVEGYGG